MKRHPWSWLLFILLVACGGTGKTGATSGETPPLIVPTPTPWATPLVIIATIPTSRTPGPAEAATAVPPTPLPTPRPTIAPTPDVLADLRLGTLADDPVCQWLSEAVITTLVEATEIKLASRAFPSADDLFADLAASTPGSSDLTLCFRDPQHRAFLQTYVGFIDFVGGGYWTDGEERRLVVAKTAVLHPLQTNHPCAYHLLQALDLGTLPLSPTQNPTQWRSQNGSKLQSWLNCG